MRNAANLTNLPHQTLPQASAREGRIGPAEYLITLTEATKILPKVNGKGPAVCTLWRWCRRGLRGQFLEGVPVGRKICTTRQALLRFFTELAEIDEWIEPGRPRFRRGAGPAFLQIFRGPSGDLQETFWERPYGGDRFGAASRKGACGAFPNRFAVLPRGVYVGRWLASHSAATQSMVRLERGEATHGGGWLGSRARKAANSPACPAVLFPWSRSGATALTSTAHRKRQRFRATQERSL